MPREKKSYRAVLKHLKETFPDTGAISLDQAAIFYGVSKRTLQRDKTFPVDAHNRVTLAAFADWLAV